MMMSALGRIATILLVIAGVFGATLTAWTASVDFYVPVILDGMPPEVSEVRVSCNLFTREGRSYSNFGPAYMTRLPFSGALRGRVVIPINPPSDAFVPPETYYSCAMTFSGWVRFEPPVRTASYGLVRGYGFQTGTELLTVGVPIRLSIDDELGRPYGGYIPYGTGTTTGGGVPPGLHTPMQPISIDVMGVFNLHGECPCGCGGNFDKGTAACSPQGHAPRIVQPLLPFDPPRNARQDLPRPSDRLHPERVGPSLPATRRPVTATAGILVFHGTGRLVQCRGTGFPTGADCPPPPRWMMP
jgi:hypothetical protein